MLDLSTSPLIGKGLHRECFEHPDDATKCLKIVVAGNSDENLREEKYYGMLARRGISWEMLARFYGLVKTSRGVGAVFELIRDCDGAVARPLSHYLEAADVPLEFEPQLGDALLQLKAYLLDNRIVTMTLKPKNIVYQKSAEEEGKLVIVDNVGNSDFLPLTNYSGFLARQKIKRKWQRFEQLITSKRAGR